MEQESNNRFVIHLTENEIRDLISDEMKKSLITIFKEARINQPIEFYHREDLAKLFKRTPNTISDWVTYEGFPEPIKKIGNTHLWLRSQVEDFMLRGNEKI